MSALLGGLVAWSVLAVGDPTGTVEVFARFEGGGSAYLMRSGELIVAGAPRSDGRADLYARTGKRTYRWIEGDRRYAVQLLDATLPWFASPDLEGATRADGDTILGRPTDQYRTKTPGRFPDLAIDRETGLLMLARRPGGEAGFTAEQVVSRPEATTLRDYGFGRDRLVMKGWVDDSWLERAARPPSSAYATDLRAMRGRSKLGNGGWIGTGAVPEGLVYLGSEHSERAPSAAKPFAGRKPLVDRQNVPDDLQVELELSDDGSLLISLRQADRMNAKVRTLPPWAGSGDFALSTGDWTLHGALYLDAAGDLHLATGPTADAARAQADQGFERSGQGNAFVRSDWVHAQTGATLTIALARSDNWPSRLRADLPELKEVRAADGVWRVFEFDGWRLVEQRQFDRTVVVAGSERSFEELARIGASVGRGA